MTRWTTTRQGHEARRRHHESQHPASPLSAASRTRALVRAWRADNSPDRRRPTPPPPSRSMDASRGPRRAGHGASRPAPAATSVPAPSQASRHGQHTHPRHQLLADMQLGTTHGRRASPDPHRTPDQTTAAAAHQDAASPPGHPFRLHRGKLHKRSMTLASASSHI